eukprot:gene8524-10849_t
MKPGERLKALREVPVKAGTLLGAKDSDKAAGPDVLLSVRNLSKTYGTRKTSWF